MHGLAKLRATKFLLRVTNTAPKLLLLYVVFTLVLWASIERFKNHRLNFFLKVPRRQSGISKLRAEPSRSSNCRLRTDCEVTKPRLRRCRFDLPELRWRRRICRVKSTWDLQREICLSLDGVRAKAFWIDTSKQTRKAYVLGSHVQRLRRRAGIGTLGRVHDGRLLVENKINT